MQIANGIVSNIGALELTMPSLLSPFLLLKNEPNESPKRQKKPRVHPKKKAVK